MDSRDLQTGLELIRKDFNLDAQELSIPEPELNEASVLEKLRRIVAYLMEKDFARLLQVLYRIDVSEDRLKAALAAQQDEPATVIAQMIFEREMQKVATRRKYSS